MPFLIGTRAIIRLTATCFANAGVHFPPDVLPQNYGQRFQNGATVVRMKFAGSGSTAHELIVTGKLFSYVLRVVFPEKRG